MTIIIYETQGFSKYILEKELKMMEKLAHPATAHLTAFEPDCLFTDWTDETDWHQIRRHANKTIRFFLARV